MMPHRNADRPHAQSRNPSFIAITLLATTVLCCAGRPLLVRARIVDGETNRPLPGVVITVQPGEMLAASDSAGLVPPTAATARSRLLVALPGYTEMHLSGRELDSALGENWDARLDIALFPVRPRRIEGEVVEAGTNRQLPGATIRIEGRADQFLTSSSGGYEITDFPPGPHVLSASLTGYVDDVKPILVRGGETTRLDFALVDTTNEGAVEGIVRHAATGRALPGVTVYIAGEGRGPTAAEVRAETDGTGRYRLDRVPVGEHRISVFADGFEPKTIPFRVLKGWTVTVDFELRRPGDQ